MPHTISLTPEVTEKIFDELEAQQKPSKDKEHDYEALILEPWDKLNASQKRFVFLRKLRMISVDNVVKDNTKKGYRTEEIVLNDSVIKVDFSATKVQPQDKDYDQYYPKQ